MLTPLYNRKSEEGKSAAIYGGLELSNLKFHREFKNINQNQMFA